MQYPPWIFILCLLVGDPVGGDTPPTLNPGLINRVVGRTPAAQSKIAAGINRTVLPLSGNPGANTETHFASYIKSVQGSRKPYESLELSIPYLARLLKRLPEITKGLERSSDVIEASSLLIKGWTPVSFLGTFLGGQCPLLDGADLKFLLDAINKLPTLEGQLRYYGYLTRYCPEDYFDDTSLPDFGRCRELVDNLRLGNLNQVPLSLGNCAGREINLDRMMAVNAALTDFGDKLTLIASLLPSNSWLLTGFAFDMALKEGARAILLLHRQMNTAAWQEASVSLRRQSTKQAIKTFPLATLSLFLPELRESTAPEIFPFELEKEYLGIMALIRLSSASQQNSRQLIREFDQKAYSMHLFPFIDRDPHRIQEDREAVVTSLIALMCERHLITEPHSLLPQKCSSFLKSLEENPFPLIAIIRRTMDGIGSQLAIHPPSFEAEQLMATMNISKSNNWSTLVDAERVTKIRYPPMGLTRSGFRQYSLNEYLHPAGIQMSDLEARCIADESVCRKRAQNYILDELDKIAQVQKVNMVLRAKARETFQQLPLAKLQEISSTIMDGGSFMKTVTSLQEPLKSIMLSETSNTEDMLPVLSMKSDPFSQYTTISIDSIPNKEPHIISQDTIGGYETQTSFSTNSVNNPNISQSTSFENNSATLDEISSLREAVRVSNPVYMTPPKPRPVFVLTPEESSSIPPALLQTLQRNVDADSDFWNSLKIFLNSGWANSPILLRWMQAKAKFGDAIDNVFDASQWETEEIALETLLLILHQNYIEHEELQGSPSQQWEQLFYGPEAKAKLELYELVQRLAPMFASSETIQMLVTQLQRQASPGLIELLFEYASEGISQLPGFWTWLRAKAKFGFRIPDEFKVEQWESPDLALQSIIQSIDESDPRLFRILKEALPRQKKLDFILNSFTFSDMTRSIDGLNQKSSINRKNTMGMLRPTPEKLRSIYSSQELLVLAQEALVEQDMDPQIIDDCEQRVIDTLKKLVVDITPEDVFAAACLRSPSLFSLLMEIRHQLAGLEDKSFDETVLLRRIAARPVQYLIEVEKFDFVNHPPENEEGALLSAVRLMFPEMARLPLEANSATVATEMKVIMLRDQDALDENEKVFLALRGIFPMDVVSILWEIIHCDACPGDFNAVIREAFRRWSSGLPSDSMSIGQFLPPLPQYYFPTCHGVNHCVKKLGKHLPLLIAKFARDQNIDLDVEGFEPIEQFLATKEIGTNLRTLYSLYHATLNEMVETEPFLLWFSFRIFDPKVVGDRFDAENWAGQAGITHSLELLGKMFPDLETLLIYVLRRVDETRALNAIKNGLKLARVTLTKDDSEESMVYILRGMAQSDTLVAREIMELNHPYAQKAVAITGIKPNEPDSLVRLATKVSVVLDPEHAKLHKFTVWSTLLNVVGLGTKELTPEMKPLVKLVVMIPGWINPSRINAQPTALQLIEAALNLDDVEGAKPGRPLRVLLDQVQEESMRIGVERIEGEETLPITILQAGAMVELKRALDQNDEDKMQVLLSALVSIIYKSELSPSAMPRLNILLEILPTLIKNGPDNYIVEGSALGSISLFQALEGHQFGLQIKLFLLQNLSPEDRYHLGEEVNRDMVSDINPISRIYDAVYTSWKSPFKGGVMSDAKQQAAQSVGLILEKMSAQDVIYHPFLGPLTMQWILEKLKSH